MFLPAIIHSFSFLVISVTVVSSLLMVILFISELNYYLTKDVQPELFVDTTRGQKLRINIDIDFPKVPCACECVVICRQLHVSYQAY